VQTKVFLRFCQTALLERGLEFSHDSVTAAGLRTDPQAKIHSISELKSADLTEKFFFQSVKRRVEFCPKDSPSPNFPLLISQKFRFGFC
jgi:hypothetical protein